MRPKGTWLAAVAAFAGLAASCTDAGPTAAEEVAGEIRALRLLLAQQSRTASAPPSPGEALDVQAALAPLQSALAALAGSQRELADRQAALAQEMQRWSQLLVESVGAARADEAKAMAAKLHELEQSLKSQDTRHREVETLIQGALDRTADRLEDFLQRLPGATPPRPGGGSTAPGTPPAATGGGNDDPQQAAGGSPLVRSPQSAMRWWWLVLTGLGAVVATFFLRRAHRPSVDQAATSLPLPPAAPAERSVEEIWAAAALLGEAVGRLRQTVGTPAAAEATPSLPADAAAGPVEPVEPPLDDVFVLAEDEDRELAAASANGVAPEPSLAPGPPLATMVAHVPGAVPEARILAALAAEPQVLRRPAPACRAFAGALEVRFHVLPGTSPGERTRLLQRLRDAVRVLG